MNANAISVSARSPASAGLRAYKQAAMNLALFDFDGTLTTVETFPLFVRLAASRARLRLGTPLFAPVVAGYRAGLVSGSAVRAAIVRYAFTGVDAAAFAERGRWFAEEMVPELLRPEAMARLDWHRARGDRIVVVSGAFDVYLAPWCARQGVELLCSSLEVRDGRLTGRYAGAQCVAAEKTRRVRTHCDLAAYDGIHAYGDTIEDRELLALADVAHYRGQPLPSGVPVDRAMRAVTRH